MTDKLKEANVKRLEAFRVVQGGKLVRPKMRVKRNPLQVAGWMLVLAMGFGLIWWIGLTTIIENIVSMFVRR